MNISEKRLRYLIRESLGSTFKANLVGSSSNSKGGTGISTGTVVRYDAAAVARAKAAGLTDEEAGSPDAVWQFKFSGSGDSRKWHASKDGSNWKDIGSDPENRTIKRLNAAFPATSPAPASTSSEESSGDEAAANVATPDSD